MATRNGIFPRLLSAMALVAIIPLAFSWYINYRSTVDQISQQVEQQLRARANALTIYVDSWIEMELKMLRQNASLADMTSMNPARQQPILNSIVKEYDKYVFLSFVSDATGMNTVRSDKETLKSFSDRLYFQQAMTGTFGADVQLARSYLRPTFALAVPIMGPDQRPQGILLAASWVTELSKVITSSKIGNSGFAYLLTDKGKTIAHHKKEFAETMKAFDDHPAFKGLGRDKVKRVDFTDNVTGKEVVSIAQRTKLGWTVVVQQDYEEAFAPVFEANRKALVVLLTGLVIVVLISIYLAGRISKPILRVTDVADRISRGDLSAKAGDEVTHIYEIKELSRAVNRLGASVRVAMEHMRRGAAHG